MCYSNYLAQSDNDFLNSYTVSSPVSTLKVLNGSQVTFIYPRAIPAYSNYKLTTNTASGDSIALVPYAAADCTGSWTSDLGIDGVGMYPNINIINWIIRSDIMDILTENMH
jgi:hypothetical protein